MEKKKSEGINGERRVGKRIIDYSFEKLGFGRRARWANEGFSWKPIRHLGFGSETICPSREIGGAIPVPHLQRFGIVIRGDSLEKNSIFRFGKEGCIPLARVKRLGISLKLGAYPLCDCAFPWCWTCLLFHRLNILPLLCEGVKQGGCWSNPCEAACSLLTVPLVSVTACPLWL